MTQLDTAICPTCRRSTTVCRQSFLGYLATVAESETWFWSLVAPIGVIPMTVRTAEDAAIAWHKLIGALVETENLTWKEAHMKAAAMIKEVHP
ncbi:hypothetical protein ACU635_13995 [[Actinomadura] parvosata]|uniref:hypothetical protein n=1 Tax=[Actinomadura] parvosata TaxID=1955412 RepID=UPI00406CEB12